MDTRAGSFPQRSYTFLEYILSQYGYEIYEIEDFPTYEHLLIGYNKIHYNCQLWS